MGTRWLERLRGRWRDAFSALAGEDLRHLVDLYDENLLSADSLLGQLIAGLRESRQLDQSVVVVMSDHGEAFREHGRLLHGDNVYQEDIRIPLLIRFPPAMRLAGRRVRVPVQISDLMPTLLSALELPPVEGATGRDWIPWLVEPNQAGEKPMNSHPIIAHGAQSKSLQDASWKLVRRRSRKGSDSSTLLFDLAADPGEQDDLTRKQAARSERLADDLDEVLRRQRGARPDESTPELAPEFIERLRALGYLSDEHGGRSPTSDASED